MAKRDRTAVHTCKACKSPMIVDETVVGAPGSRRIKRVFLHCVNEECGHIERLHDVFVQDHATA